MDEQFGTVIVKVCAYYDWIDLERLHLMNGFISNRINL